MTRRDEQHPQYVDSWGRTFWRASCNACGTYVEDWTYEPPVDYLCDDCQEPTDA